jgi:hypothetical protein
MTASDAAKWHARRARLNHDWLRVKFLTFVQAWQQELDRHGEAGDLEEPLRSQLAQWRQSRVGLEELLAAAEDALSPANLEDDVTPADLSDEEKRELRVATHAEWIEQSGIRDRLASVREDAAAVDSLVAQLLTGEPIPQAGTRLYEMACKVSDGLSSLNTEAGGA